MAVLNVNGKALKGIDLVQFDAEGKIVDFEVMVRPLSGLQALGAEMGARLAAHMPAFKVKGVRQRRFASALKFTVITHALPGLEARATCVFA